MPIEKYTPEEYMEAFDKMNALTRSGFLFEAILKIIVGKGIMTAEELDHHLLACFSERFPKSKS